MSIEKLRYYLRTNTTIDDRQIDRIMNCFIPRIVSRDTILLSDGAICNELYFVNKGCIRTYYITKQGLEKTRHIAFEGSVATAISSFISQQPSFEFVDALEDSELYAIGHRDFYMLVAETPQWEAFYRNFLERAYLQQNRKIETLITLSAKQRYEHLLAETPHPTPFQQDTRFLS
jgi:CRP-like cAMP-binding protein